MGGKRNIALLVIACVVGLAVIAWLNRPRDEPAKATVDDAVRSFRAKSDAGPQGGQPGDPPHGVYRYATRGSESVQTAIGGATHGYGGISTITLSTGRCGERERWQVLTGRWAEVEACTGSRGETFRATEFHEFFGVGQEDSFRCHSSSAFGRPVQRPGSRFSSVCKSDGSSIVTRSRVIGRGKISVGGESFDAIKIESRSTVEGETAGTARREEWRRRSDGLLLRRSAENDAEANQGGGSDYSERYTIRLLEVVPRR